MLNKKIILFAALFILIVLAFSACSKEKNKDISSNHIEESEGENTTTNDEIDNEKSQPLISTQIEDSVIYTSEHSGATIYVSAVIKNTGNVPVELGYISFDIEDEKGGFIKNIRRYTKSTPTVINPNESAFVCELDIDRNINAKDCKKLIIHYEPKETKMISTFYQTESIKIKPYSGDFYGITGRAINNNEKTAEKVVVAAVLYGENDKFLGVINTYPLDKINSGGKLGFEINKTPIPDSAFKLDKIKRIVPIASD